MIPVNSGARELSFQHSLFCRLRSEKTLADPIWFRLDFHNFPVRLQFHPRIYYSLNGLPVLYLDIISSWLQFRE